MSLNQPKDLSLRRTALDPHTSFAVRAPAGSGKTELLTQRVMNLLAYSDKPEEILAITFTKKAAAEMRERILHALLRAQKNTPPELEHDKFTWELAKKVLQRNDEQKWNLLQNPNRLRIQTIDSFCRFLSGQQPVTSQLGTLPDTLDDRSQTDFALRQAFRQTLDELDGNNGTAEALKAMLLHFDNDIERLEALVISMLAKRDQWLEHLLHLTDDDQIQDANKKLVEHLLKQAYNALQTWHGQLTTYFNHAVENSFNPESENNLYPSGNFKKFPAPNINNIGHWRDLFKFLTGENNVRKPRGLNISIGIPPNSPLKKEIQEFFAELAEQPGIEEILMFSKKMPDHPVRDAQLIIVLHIQKLLLHCVANLKLTFNQMRATDYTEIALAAIEALGNEDQPSDLSLKLDYKIKHILVDEFQDTSHLQLKLLTRLTAGWQPGDGHSLFIVGDAMQSCYSFRNADVRIFLDVMKNGLGNIQLTTLTLSENFRSESSIVNWNNELFSRAFPKIINTNLSAVSYTPSTAFNQQQRANAVRCYGFHIKPDGIPDDDNKNSSPDYDAIEAETIVELIKDIQTNKSNETIAVLVRNRSHVKSILPALKAANIAWQATDMDNLSQRMAIHDLKNLVRAMLYPADHLAWLALLRSPIAGLELGDLLLLAESKDSTNQQRLPIITLIQEHDIIRKLSDDGQKILARLSPPLLQAFAQQQRKPLRQWVEGLWYSLGGPAGCDSRQLDDCLSFLDLLEHMDDAGQIRDWPALDAALEKLYAQDKQQAENPVQIMTIHKAKGLEFDHVILPGLAKMPRGNDRELFMWNDYWLDHHEQVLVFGSAQEKGADKQDLHLEFLKKIQKTKLSNETLRLLYVACTRAKVNLYLFGALAINDGGKPKEPNKNSLLFPIWEFFSEKYNIMDEALSEKSASKKTRSNLLEHIRRLPTNFCLPELPEFHELAAYRGHEYSEDKNIPELTSLDNWLTRQIGTVIHKTLQKISENGPANWQHHHFTTRQQQWKLDLSLLRVPERLHNEALNKIELAVTKTLASSQGQWILDNKHKNSCCELALSLNGKVSIIDRSFIDKDICWVIDYKTSQPSNNQNIEDFFSAQVAQYQQQLQNYRALLKKMHGLEVKTALYFPLLDKLLVT